MTSVPADPWLNRASSARLSVALKTKLPDMKATPSAIASAVSPSLTRWASNPRTVTRNTTAHPSPKRFIESMTASGVGPSRNRVATPSARNTTRSA